MPSIPDKWLKRKKLKKDMQELQHLSASPPLLGYGREKSGFLMFCSLKYTKLSALGNRSWAFQQLLMGLNTFHTSAFCRPVQTLKKGLISHILLRESSLFTEVSELWCYEVYKLNQA